MESNETSVADHLKGNLPQLLHKYNFNTEADLQIMEFDHSVETVPNCLLFVQRNCFMIEIGDNQSFKFIFFEGDVMTLLAVGLRRNDIIPPLTQIAASKVPLVEILVKVKFYFIKFLYIFSNWE